LFGDNDAESYVVIATKDKPRMRRGGQDDGKPLHVDAAKDYIIVKLPLSTLKSLRHFSKDFGQLTIRQTKVSIFLGMDNTAKNVFLYLLSCIFPEFLGIGTLH